MAGKFTKCPKCDGPMLVPSREWTEENSLPPIIEDLPSLEPSEASKERSFEPLKKEAAEPSELALLKEMRGHAAAASETLAEISKDTKAINHNLGCLFGLIVILLILEVIATLATVSL